MAEYSLRVICTYEGEEVSVKSMEWIEMLSPESDPLKGFDKHVGFWLEMRSTKDEILYRQIMPDPFRPEVEVFAPPDQKQTAFLAPVDEVSGHLVLLVPDAQDAREIVLVRAVAGPGENERKVHHVAKIPVPANEQEN